MLARGSGLPSSKLLRFEFQVQKLLAQQAVCEAQQARDVKGLRSAVMRASRLGIDQDTMESARHALQVLSTEETVNALGP